MEDNLKNESFPSYFSMDDYAKDGGPGVVWPLCSFYREPLRSLIVKEVQLLGHLISHWFQIEDWDSVKPFKANLWILVL